MSTKTLAFERTGILPVISIPEIEAALPLAKALLDGGIESLEITLRSACALDAIKLIKETYPQMTIGAGTVLSIQNIQDAVAAGADFIVSPGYDEELVDYCLSHDILTTPGCTSASEIQAAVKKGLKILKFFPAELSGGLEAIKLLSGPFPTVKFLPTGGINFDNLGKYLSNEKIIACGGSYMATADQIKKGDWEGITAACKKAVTISMGFELAHVGVNNESAEDAVSCANTLGSIFRMPVKDGDASTFTGTAVEFMKIPYYGTHGHIGFKTNSMTRALAYLEDNHIEIIEESIRRDAKGKPEFAYLRNEIGGFAVHIVKK